MTPESVKYPKLSCARAGHNMATSRWIRRTTSRQLTIVTPRIVSRLCTYSILTARPWSPVQPSLKVLPFLKEGLEVVAMAEQVKKVKTPTHMIRSGGRTRNATSVTRKETHRPTAPRSRPRMTTIDPGRAPSSALINSRRVSSL
jgi:hypothetical protein